MTFVQMANRRSFANSAKCSQSADSEYDLLLNAHFLVAAIKLGGDLAIIGMILGYVAIEQVKRHAADLDPPNFRLHRSSRKRYRDQDGVAGGVGFVDQRQG